MKRLFTVIFAVAGCLKPVYSQQLTPNIRVKTANVSPSPRVPQYVVYKHFLAWINSLDEQARSKGATDRYGFAEPFARAGLSHKEIDDLRTEAQALQKDLDKQDRSAQLVIGKYRGAAKLAVSEGHELPPLPAQIRDLERERTALVIHHYVALQAALGTDRFSVLDQYVHREFTPHIKLQRVSAPELEPKLIGSGASFHK